jgi:preprotein translocase subunit SecG
MTFLIGVLTVLLVLNCLLLILLVLVQLPKKDAGAGMAFGGGTADALFGAGSGSVLTRITKYVAGSFFFIALTLSLMQQHVHQTSVFDEMEREVPAARTGPAPGTPAPGTPETALPAPAPAPPEPAPEN